LKQLGIIRINLLTNNPEKLEAFENSGIHVESRIPVIISPVADNERYLQTKKDGMGHMI
jgi:3,4-dihydroxy 2-butanone 4-phosphate synthase/GTP cyclohydrolase II